MPMKTLHLILITAIACLMACSNQPSGETNTASISNRDAFMKEHGFATNDSLPQSFSDGRWKEIGGSYYVYVANFEQGGIKKCMMLLANKKENVYKAALNINPWLCIGRQGTGIHSGRIIIPFEYISRQEYDYSNNMDEFNRLLGTIPELKGFTWKNELQNKLMCGLLMYSQFRTISDKSSAKAAESRNMGKEDKVQAILKGDCAFSIRNFLRFHSETDLCQEIERLGFRASSNASGHCYARELFQKGEFDFKDKSNFMVYYPFVSYESNSGDNLYYLPAACILNYHLSFTGDKFPQFSRQYLYISLLDKKVKKF